MSREPDSSASLVGGLVSMARGIGTTFGISLMALAWHLGSQSYQAGNPGYSGSEQARPAFAVLAVVAATAATIALASRRGRGDQRSGPGRGARQVRTTEGHLAQQPGAQPRTRSAGPDRVGPDQVRRRADRPGAGRHRVPAAPGHAPGGARRRPRPRPFRGPARAAFLHHRAPRDQAGPARPDAPAGAELGGHPARRAAVGGVRDAHPGADSDGDRRTVSLDLSEAGAQAVSRWHRVNEDIIRAALAGCRTATGPPARRRARPAATPGDHTPSRRLTPSMIMAQLGRIGGTTVFTEPSAGVSLQTGRACWQAISLRENPGR